MHVLKIFCVEEYMCTCVVDCIAEKKYFLKFLSKVRGSNLQEVFFRRKWLCLVHEQEHFSVRKDNYIWTQGWMNCFFFTSSISMSFVLINYFVEIKHHHLRLFYFISKSLYIYYFYARSSLQIHNSNIFSNFEISLKSTK